MSKTIKPTFSLFKTPHLFSLSTKPPLSLSSSLFPKPISFSLSSNHSLPRVSTTPLIPSPLPSNLEPELSRLKSLNSNLSASRSLSEKLKVINRDERVKRFFNGNVPFKGLREYEVYLLKCVVAIGQEHVLGLYEERERGGLRAALYKLAEMVERFDIDGLKSDDGLKREEVEALRGLLKVLGEMERFYDCIGGIVGYQNYTTIVY